jgi:dTDP-4-dehydrorhamnose 3,5-epimerase
MRVVPTAIPDVKLVVPARHGDARGFFSETWNRRDFEAAGLVADWVQDNHARSRDRGVLRGLHFQVGAAAQTKLVRVTRGSIFDVAVDLRRSSPTFGRFVTVTLSAEEWNQLYVPRGFAHGYCTLEPDTEVVYKVDAYYAPALDRGVLWNDPDLAVPWPVSGAEALLSEKDRKLPHLSALPPQFE